MITQAVYLLADGSGGRVFGLDQQTLINILIQLLNACILAAVLGFVLYKPVREFMQKRTQKISGQLDEAKNKAANAEKLKAEYEKKLKDIQAERAAILDAARIEANKKSKQVVDRAKEEAAAIKERAEEVILNEKKRLESHSKQYIIEVSSLMTSKLIKKSADRAVQDQIFDDAVAELEKTTWLV